MDGGRACPGIGGTGCPPANASNSRAGSRSSESAGRSSGQKNVIATKTAAAPAMTSSTVRSSMSVNWRTPCRTATATIHARAAGMSHFQPKRMNWS